MVGWNRHVADAERRGLVATQAAVVFLRLLIPCDTAIGAVEHGDPRRRRRRPGLDVHALCGGRRELRGRFLSRWNHCSRTRRRRGGGGAARQRECDEHYEERDRLRCHIESAVVGLRGGSAKRRMALSGARGGGLLLLLPLASALGLRLAPALARPFLLLALLALAVGRRLGTIDELEVDDGGAVAAADAGVDDARVPAVAVGVARADLIEEPAHHLGVRHHRQRLAPGVQALALGQRHHVVGQAADGFRLGLRRLDALVAEEGGEHVAKHGCAVLADPAQSEAMVTVPHRTTPPPRLSVPRMLGSMRMPIESPSAASAVLISSMDFSPRFFTCSRSASVFWARSATTWISAF